MKFARIGKPGEIVVLKLFDVEKKRKPAWIHSRNQQAWVWPTTVHRIIVVKRLKLLSPRRGLTCNGHVSSGAKYLTQTFLPSQIRLEWTAKTHPLALVDEATRSIHSGQFPGTRCLATTFIDLQGV